MDREQQLQFMKSWQADWCLFARQVLRARLDDEQKAVLRAVQNNKMVAVASGTARGKDFVAAVAALCFLYLTPRFSGNKLIANTKVALTAPTGRQIDVIMIPEVSRLFRSAQVLPGRLMARGIRTNYDEWFLTGFKSDENNTEAWSGFHAVNTMFIVTPIAQYRTTCGSNLPTIARVKLPCAARSQSREVFPFSSVPIE